MLNAMMENENTSFANISISFLRSKKWQDQVAFNNVSWNYFWLPQVDFQVIGDVMLEECWNPFLKSRTPVWDISRTMARPVSRDHHALRTFLKKERRKLRQLNKALFQQFLQQSYQTSKVLWSSINSWWFCSAETLEQNFTK